MTQQYYTGNDKSNCTVIRNEIAEADDLIARFIAKHPDDEHFIISSDTDFIQLITPNVKQYNGITDELHTVDGIFNDKGNRVIDKKTKEPKVIPDPKWLLFEKCMRGDTSDNVFSACPGARKKGTKNKVGMLEAFADKDSKGYNWNNFMLQRWTDHEGVEHRVLEDYQRNMHIIDLTAQPDNIKAELDSAIVQQVQKESKSQVGIHFMKFCGKWDMVRVSERAQDHAEYLNKAYGG